MLTAKNPVNIFYTQTLLQRLLEQASQLLSTQQHIIRHQNKNQLDEIDFPTTEKSVGMWLTSSCASRLKAPVLARYRWCLWRPLAGNAHQCRLLQSPVCVNKQTKNTKSNKQALKWCHTIRRQPPTCAYANISSKKIVHVPIVLTQTTSKFVRLFPLLQHVIFLHNLAF